jgi:hypothetical protein
MRELAVYFCPKCGRYAYYQLARNAVCPRDDEVMTLLNMPYTEFVHLGNAERDSLITSEIMKDCPSISTRIKTANQLHNERFAVASLQERIRELENDNRQLNETIEWMHKTIWDLLARNKALQRQLDIKDRDDPEKC